MSWNRYSKNLIWYDIFRGLWSQEPIGDIPADTHFENGEYKKSKGSLYLYRANNVYAPGISSILRKRPGFSQVRSTAIDSAGIFTSMIHQGEMADRFLMTVSISGGTHNIYEDDGNPPTTITGGTNFTVGQDNLVAAAHFNDGTNPGTILVSRSQDLPQFINNTGTRSNFTIAGTGLTSLKPAMVEVFGQRALYGDCNVDGTVFDDRVYWSAIRDGNLIDDPTTDFESFETTEKDRVRSLKKISDLIIVGKKNNVFSMVVTPTYTKPFAIQEEPAGRLKGPVSHQAVIEADQRLWWLGQSNIHSFDRFFNIRDWADIIKPTLTGLDQARLDFAVAGYDHKTNMLLFSVSENGQTTHNICIGLNIKTGAIYIWSLARNAFATRDISGDFQLVGGGYTGKFYNELSGTSGNLDDATAVIDGDVITPKMPLNAYGYKQKIPLIFIAVDPIGSEALTVTYALDDDDILTAGSTPTGSPYTVTGTDHHILAVPIKGYAERIQLRIRNNTADAVYSVKSIGIPDIPLQLKVSS